MAGREGDVIRVLAAGVLLLAGLWTVWLLWHVFPGYRP